MYYILIAKSTNKVSNIRNKKPLCYTDNLLLAEVESLPDKYDYLTAENIREKIDTWQEVIEDYDDNGDLVSKEVEKSRTYTTCDLIANFKGDRVISETIKEKIRNDKIVRLIRKKYSVDEELAILRQKDTKPDKFNEYFSYASECVNKVPKE